MWVKICGLTRAEDVAAAVEAGADAVGFVFEPSSPRCVGTATTLHADVPARVESVAVFGPIVETDLTGFSTIQYISGEPPPNKKHIRAIRLDSPDGGFLGQEIVVLDAFDAVAYGGTGRRVDWHAASEFVAEFPGRVILAGGLTPDNVADAIKTVRPWGVDVSSGVESAPGKKDHDKVAAFISAAKNH